MNQVPKSKISKKVKSVLQADPSVVAQYSQSVLNPRLNSITNIKNRRPLEFLDSLVTEYERKQALRHSSSAGILKESGPASMGVSSVEAGKLKQTIESHPSHPETTPEVEAYLEHVEKHKEQLPDKIVIAQKEETAVEDSDHLPEDSIVLPISKKDAQKAKKKDPSFSIRWLYEWSCKIAKKFKDRIFYRVT